MTRSNKAGIGPGTNRTAVESNGPSHTDEIDLGHDQAPQNNIRPQRGPVSKTGRERTGHTKTGRTSREATEAGVETEEEATGNTNQKKFKSKEGTWTGTEVHSMKTGGVQKVFWIKGSLVMTLGHRFT